MISEVLTPEEMHQKVRFQEHSQSDGNDLSIVDVISGDYPKYNQFIHYYLELLFREESHEYLLKFCKRATRTALAKNFRDRKLELGEFKFNIVNENPKDVIYISEAYGTPPNEKVGIICIARDMRIGKWKSILAYFSLSSELTLEKKEAIIERLKNAPSINSWISKSKNS